MNLQEIEFFQQLPFEKQINLFNKLSDKQKKELLSNLSFYFIKDLCEKCNKQEQLAIYENLSPDRLRALYDSYPQYKKQDMLEIIEERQLNLNNNLEIFRNNIQTSTSILEKSTQSIEQSQINIASSKENIHTKKQELKENKVVMKKLTQERKKALKAVMKAQKSASPLRLSNRIGIISKRRTKKLLEKLQYLEQQNQSLDTAKATNNQLKQEINDLKTNIIKEKRAIDMAKIDIENARLDIKKNTTNMIKTETKIKKLSKSEKQMLGRKLYNKTVFERDYIVTRKKPMQQQKNDTTNPKETIVEAEPIIDIPTSEKTEDNVKALITRADGLQEMGINFYQPNSPLNGLQPPELLSEPIMQVTKEQLIIMNYTMLAMYNMYLQQMMKQQQEQNLSNGYTKTLSPKSRGSVNLILLINIILFTISFILFILK